MRTNAAFARMKFLPSWPNKAQPRTHAKLARARTEACICSAANPLRSLVEWLEFKGNKGELKDQACFFCMLDANNDTFVELLEMRAWYEQRGAKWYDQVNHLRCHEAHMLHATFAQAVSSGAPPCDIQFPKSC